MCMKVVAYTYNGASLGHALTIFSNIRLNGNKLAWDKHSSLFGPALSDKEKNVFYKNLKRPLSMFSSSLTIGLGKIGQLNVVKEYIVFSGKYHIWGVRHSLADHYGGPNKDEEDWAKKVMWKNTLAYFDLPSVLKH